VKNQTAQAGILLKEYKVTKEKSVQIGMGTGTMKSNSTSRRVNFIDEYPIALNMTAERSFPPAVKRMVTAFRRQGLFVDYHVHDFVEFTNIHAASFHQLALFFESICKCIFQHRLMSHLQKINRLDRPCQGLPTSHQKKCTTWRGFLPSSWLCLPQ